MSSIVKIRARKEQEESQSKAKEEIWGEDWSNFGVVGPLQRTSPIPISPSSAPSKITRTTLPGRANGRDSWEILLFGLREEEEEEEVL